MQPRWASDHQLLAAVARRLFDQCRETNRALVDAGQLDRDIALSRVRVMRTIAADWKAVAARAPAPDWLEDPTRGGSYALERIEALEEAGRGARDAAGAAPGDHEVVGFADAIETLLWWESASPSARFYADVNRSFRELARACHLEAAPAGQPSLFGMAA